MELARKIIGIIIGITMAAIIYIYRDNISDFIIKKFITNKDIVVYSPNNYYRDTKFQYVIETDDFYPKSKDDLLKIFYTVLNRGWNTFTFYCDEEYTECQNDIKKLINNDDSLSNLNNFVHPYNSYKNLQVELSGFGGVTINVIKLYSTEETKYINEQIDKFIKENIDDTMSINDQILKYHDYIASITTYDKAEAEQLDNYIINNNLKSYKATNIFENNLSLCGGYTDAMAIYLNKLGIVNYKISNAKHIWNYLYLDKKWYHLDLTWDDPVTSDGSDIVLHDFFLINTAKLEELNTKQHEYDKNIYQEA